MAITLQTLFEETNHLYGLQLVAGEEGLSRIVNWVYVSEDPSTVSFLKGGELIISTGVLYHQNEKWLLQFLQGLIVKNCSGLIINTGKYIDNNILSREVIDLCNKTKFPLFFMPWETKIYDITHDYYNRLFEDVKISDSISDAFYALITNNRDLEHYLDLLNQEGFHNNDTYSVCIISENFRSDILLVLKNFVSHLPFSCQICQTKDFFYLIAINTNETAFHSECSQLNKELQNEFPNHSFHLGVSTTVSSLKDISLAFMQADTSRKYAAYKNLSYCTFAQLGTFQLFASIQNKKVLTAYMDSTFSLLSFLDSNNKKIYKETIKQYILCHGSVKKMAEILFCHRNTINYRLNIIRESSSINLDDAQVLHQFMTAFAIEEYLRFI